ncbi:flagellar export protein FliJ [Paenisporosarcina sp.]|uniref:flagellar export protein FliJ n=1 Tax=Paenisporosarcina sp. TaxID=1932001 RepID=UPI003C7795B6
MTKFNFRFQKILDLKEIEKDFAQIQMADAIKLEEVGHRKKEAIYNKIQDAERLKKDWQQDGIHISELRMLGTYIHQLQDLLVSSDHELMHLQNNVTKTQNQLQMKAQEEKTWGNLKDQDLTMYVERNKVVEQNFFDDLASTRFYRTSQASLAERG